MNRKFLGWVGAAALALATFAQAQTPDFVIDTFDTSDEAAGWARWWGSASQSYDWDGTVDANNSPNSGSLKLTIGFDINAYGGDNQFSAVHYFGQSLDGTTYTNLVFDVRFDTNSPSRPQSKDYGYFEYALVPSDYSQVGLGSLTVPIGNGGWTHVVAPIDPTIAKLTNIIGVNLKLWAGDTSPNADSALTGQTVIWVDNVKLIGQTNTAPIPAPTASISVPKPGLSITASNPGDQYQRQNLVTLNPVSWVGASGPVTYSLTITGFPDTNHSAFQGQIFLIPATSLPGETAPDYNEPNLIFLQIGENADGSAYASLHYKTNEPSGNAMVYNNNPANGPVGSLGGIGSASPLGTWSLTFNNNTDITVTEPGGNTANFSISADAAALFADPLYAYFGGQPNQLANIGQTLVLNHIQITGVANPVDEKFTSPTIDTTTWAIRAADPNGLVVVPGDTAYKVTWTLPDFGYGLQWASGVKGPWSDTGLSTVTVGKTKSALVPTSSLPGVQGGFFRLYKP